VGNLDKDVEAGPKVVSVGRDLCIVIGFFNVIKISIVVKDFSNGLGRGVFCVGVRGGAGGSYGRVVRCDIDVCVGEIGRVGQWYRELRGKCGGNLG
jgi:hypothetical protein